MTEKFTADVFVEDQHSERVEAESSEEAAKKAAQYVEDEYWPDKVVSARVVDDGTQLNGDELK